MVLKSPKLEYSKRNQSYKGKEVNDGFNQNLTTYNMSKKLEENMESNPPGIYN